MSGTWLHACSLFLLKLSTVLQVIAILQFLLDLYTNISPAKGGTALQKGKALEKGTANMEANDAPDWTDDGANDAKKEPAIAEAATAKPAAAAAEEKKTSPPRGVAEVGKANPPKKSPTRPAGDSNTQTPARKNPPPRKNVKEEPNQWSKPHSSWEPKESWEDGWDDGWDDGWGDWSYEKKGWNLDQKKWSWGDDHWYGKKWDDDSWGSQHQKSETSGSSKERKRFEMLKEQCPNTDKEVLRLAAMGGSRFHRLQRRMEEREDKREQAEKMKNLETQVSQLQQCNMQWMHYYQQQASWQTAAAMQWDAHANHAAEHVQGPTLSLKHGLVALASCFAKPVSDFGVTFMFCFFCTISAGQPSGKTRKYEEPAPSSSGSSSSDTGPPNSKGLHIFVTAVFFCKLCHHLCC